MKNNENKFELTADMLAEMAKDAMALGVPATAITYSQAQQILTIKTLERFLKTYGISLPVSVDEVGGYVRRTESK
jgi:hypothetical protein